jgi:hypothetical protein
MLLLLLLTTVYVMPIPATNHSEHSSNVSSGQHGYGSTSVYM